MILSPEELIELTGKKNRSAQAQVLRYMGVEHRCRPNGSLVVLKSHVEKVFGGAVKPETTQTSYFGVAPDFSKVN